MSRILCCCELGAGYGHLYRVLPIALALAQRGHRVQVALPNQWLARARTMIEHTNNPELPLTLLPAPAWEAPLSARPPSWNYAQNLLRNGYWHTPSLQAQFLAWLRLYQACEAEIVLTEHAPTALLAARAAALPCLALGTGFSLPPLCSPMPTLQPWFDIPPRRLAQIETEFVAHLNHALQPLGGQPLAQVADIFTGAARILCSLPEFDHYAVRAAADCAGPLLHTATGASADWPEAGGERVFVYLNAANRLLHPLLQALDAHDAAVLAVIPNLPEAECVALSSARRRILTTPVDLNEIAASASLAVTQGGANAGTFLLLQGIPLLVCPLELEQFLWGWRLAAQKLAVVVNWFDPRPNLAASVAAALSAERTPRQDFARRYATLDPLQPLKLVVQHPLLQPGSSPS